MRQKIELTTSRDVEEFIEKIQSVKEDVKLEGIDENGNNWQISAKSQLGKLILKSNTDRDNTNLDWNTTECVCDRDIYSLISKWAVGSQLEA